MATKHPLTKAEEPKDPVKAGTAGEGELDTRGGMKIEGTAMKGKKTETRLFQTAPDTKTWLTKEQALEKGFFWKDAA